ncbi:MAG: YdeI/OmpD-associated family protein [Acidobacteriota bacterium]
MAKKATETLEVRDRRAWRRWLEEHHDAASEVWLVFLKRHTGLPCLEYQAAVEEALCFGWVDSLIKRIDQDRYARKFTPRRHDSHWSTANRLRYADLAARGLLAPAGARRQPTERDGDAPRPDTETLPPYIRQAFDALPRAGTAFERLAPSRRRVLIGWIDSAKREETRQRRLREALRLLAEGRPLGLK